MATQRSRASFRYIEPVVGYTASYCADCGMRRVWHAVKGSGRLEGKPTDCPPQTAKRWAYMEGWRPLDKRRTQWVCQPCATRRGIQATPFYHPDDYRATMPWLNPSPTSETGAG